MSGRSKVKGHVIALHTGVDPCACDTPKPAPPPVVVHVPKQPVPPPPPPPKDEPKQPKQPVPPPPPPPPVVIKCDPNSDYAKQHPADFARDCGQPPPPPPPPTRNCDPNSLWAQQNYEVFMRECGTPTSQPKTPDGVTVQTLQPPPFKPTVTATLNIPPPFKPTVTATLNIPSRDPRMTDDCLRRYNGTPAFQERGIEYFLENDELCGDGRHAPSYKPGDVTHVPPSAAKAPSKPSILEVKLPAGKDADKSVAVATGIGRDRVKAHASSNAQSSRALARFENPGADMQRRGVPVAPQLSDVAPKKVHTIGFVNIKAGAKAFSAAFEGGQWVPTADVLERNKRWIQLAGGESALLVDYPMAHAETFLVMSPDGLNQVFSLDPAHESVLDGVAYANVVSVASPKANAPATGCGWRKMFAAPGYDRYASKTIAVSEGVAPAGCPGGCGGMMGRCRGGGCKAAYEPMWVHGQGYASATGTAPAGAPQWSGTPHDHAHARNQDACDTIPGFHWEIDRCVLNPTGDGGGGTETTQATCEAGGKHWYGNACHTAPESDEGGLSDENTGLLIQQAGNFATALLRGIFNADEAQRVRTQQATILQLTNQANAAAREGRPTADVNAQLMEMIADMRATASRNNVTLPQTEAKPNNLPYILGAAVVLGAAYMYTQKNKTP